MNISQFFQYRILTEALYGIPLRDNNIFYAANECRISDEIYYDLTIPTSVVGNNEISHPSVLYIPEKFNRYAWWMAAAPLPIALGGDYEAYENPEVFCSINGKDWIVPPGLTNPIAPDPGVAVGDHNSDPCIVLSPNRKTLYVCWNEISGGGTTDSVKMKSSNDGVSWSAAVTLKTGPTTTERFLSPALCWEAENNRWMLFTVDIIPANNTMKYSTASDLTGLFSASTACTYTLPDGETSVWHIDIRKLATGRWFGLAGTEKAGAAHQTYPMESDNGLTWRFGKQLSKRLGYKCGFVPLDDSSALLYWAFRGGPDWHFELVKLRFDRQLYSSNQAIFVINSDAGALAKIGRYYSEDSFARANEAPCLTADSGETWAMTIGQLNVVSNRLVANSATNNIGVINVGFADAEVIVNFSNVTASFAYIVLRLSTASAMQRIGLTLTELKFQRVGGVGTADLRSTALDSSATRTIRIVCQGTQYRVFADDTFMFTIDDGDHVANTRFGIQLSEVATTVKQIIISRI